MTPYITPEIPPTKKGWTGLEKILIICVVVLLVFGGVAVFKNSLSLGSTSALAAPAPETRVTGTGTGTATVASGEAPASCLRALDEADEIIQISADTMGIVSQTFTDIANMDGEAVGEDADAISRQTEKLSDSEYPTYAAACRAGR